MMGSCILINFEFLFGTNTSYFLELTKTSQHITNHIEAKWPIHNDKTIICTFITELQVYFTSDKKI